MKSLSFFIRLRNSLLLWRPKVQPSFSNSMFVVSILIICFYLSIRLPSSLFPLGFPANILNALFISILIQGNKVLLNNLAVAQLIKKYLSSYGIHRFITLFAGSVTGSCSEPFESNPRCHTYFPKSFVVLSSHPCPCLLKSFFTSNFGSTILYFLYFG